MRTEQQRLIVRRKRAEALIADLIRKETGGQELAAADERLQDHYELFIIDIETYLEHYQFEIKKVERGLKKAIVLKDKPAQIAFLEYITEDSSRTVLSLKIANYEYHEILMTLPVEGYDT